MITIRTSFLLQNCALSQINYIVRNELISELGLIYQVDSRTPVELTFEMPKIIWPFDYYSNKRKLIDTVIMSAVITFNSDELAIAGVPTTYEIVDKGMLIYLFDYFKLNDVTLLLEHDPEIHRMKKSGSLTTTITTTTTIALPTTIPTDIPINTPQPTIDPGNNEIGFSILGLVGGAVGACIVLGGAAVIRCTCENFMISTHVLHTLIHFYN